MGSPTWLQALDRYRVPRRLETRARRAAFTVATVGDALIATPASGSPRMITGPEFERSLPLIDGAGSGPLQEVTFNSSYIRAIVDDLRRA